MKELARTYQNLVEDATRVMLRLKALFRARRIKTPGRSVLQTPWRFRTKRHLWAYAGLAVVTRATAEYELHGTRAVRRRRPPMTRGLNRNHSRVLKNVLKGAATAASTRRGPLQDFYQAMLARGMREELAA